VCAAQPSILRLRAESHCQLWTNKIPGPVSVDESTRESMRGCLNFTSGGGVIERVAYEVLFMAWMSRKRIQGVLTVADRIVVGNLKLSDSIESVYFVVCTTFHGQRLAMLESINFEFVAR